MISLFVGHSFQNLEERELRQAQCALLKGDMSQRDVELADACISAVFNMDRIPHPAKPAKVRQ